MIRERLIGSTGRECHGCGEFKPWDAFPENIPICYECIGGGKSSKIKYYKESPICPRCGRPVKEDEQVTWSDVCFTCRRREQYHISRKDVLEFIDSSTYVDLVGLVENHNGESVDRLLRSIKDFEVESSFSKGDCLTMRGLNRLMFLFEIVDSDLIRVHTQSFDRYYYKEIEDDVTFKKCRSCGRLLPIVYFKILYKNKSNILIFNNTCRECLSK